MHINAQFYPESTRDFFEENAHIIYVLREFRIFLSNISYVYFLETFLQPWRTVRKHTINVYTENINHWTILIDNFIEEIATVSLALYENIFRYRNCQFV